MISISEFGFDFSEKPFFEHFSPRACFKKDVKKSQRTLDWSQHRSKLDFGGNCNRGLSFSTQGSAKENQRSKSKSGKTS
jgi:hypothetical protein